MKNKAPNFWHISKTLLPYFWTRNANIKLRFFSGIMLVILGITFNISVPLLLKSTVNELTLSKNFNLQLIILILSYGIFWTLSKVSENLRLAVMYLVVERGIRVIAVNLLKHIHSLSYRFYIDKKTGFFINIIQRVQNGVPNLFFWFFYFCITNYN